MYPYYQARDNYPPYDPNAGYPPQQPGFQPGYPPQPGYPQPSYPQQPQYGAPSQPGYPTQSGYGDAYAQPGYPTQQAGYNQYVDPRYQNMYNNIPPSMPLQPLTGKKKAVLIGINYFGTSSALKGCINDVKNVAQLLMTYGFQFDLIHCLTDDQQEPFWKPYKANILREVEWLAFNAQPGDSLFFMFSGHGGQVKDRDGDEEDGYDETICPLDYQQNGSIVDDILHDKLVKPLPVGCRLTSLMDCCHSGTGLDLPYVVTDDDERNRYNQDFRTMNPQTARIAQSKTSQGDVILFSGCQDDQCSADSSFGREPQGAMTYSLLNVLKSHPNITYKEMLRKMRAALKSSTTKFSQVPQMSTGKPFDVNASFAI